MRIDSLAWMVAAASMLGVGAVQAAAWPDLSTPPAEVGGGARDAAVVVGIEGYFAVPSVPGAVQNAEDWYRWLTKTRGVPVGSVKLLRDADATKGDILDAVSEMRKRVKTGGTLWFVFIGHGAPRDDPKRTEGLLLGVDVQQKVRSLSRRGVAVESELLPKLRVRGVETVAVLDACFNGRDQAGESLVPGTQFAVPIEVRGGEVTVLSAGRSDQVAGPLPGVARPAFSYLVLGAMRGWGDRDGDRQVSASEAVAYADEALRALNQRQQPSLSGPRDQVLASKNAREKGPDLTALVLGTSSVVGSRDGRTFGSALDRQLAELEAQRKTREDAERAAKALRERLQREHGAAVDAAWEKVAAFARTGGPEARRAVQIFLDEFASHPLGNPRADDARALIERLSAGGGGSAGKAGVTWVRIAGGSFRMGSADGDDDEKPPHRVTVATFEIAKSEVTIAQYRACVDAGACTAPGTGTAFGECNWDRRGRDDHPVNCVDWNQAQAFATWVGGRLPTEAEWEYAARSGGRNQTYPWGDEKATCERAVMDDGSGNGCGLGDKTGAVCSKPRGHSARGLCDLAGNVWEWVEDVYVDSYIGAPADGSGRRAGGARRVVRGGSWYINARFVRAAIRTRLTPTNRFAYVGFRPAR